MEDWLVHWLVSQHLQYLMNDTVFIHYVYKNLSFVIRTFFDNFLLQKWFSDNDPLSYITDMHVTHWSCENIKNRPVLYSLKRRIWIILCCLPLNRFIFGMFKQRCVSIISVVSATTHSGVMLGNMPLNVQKVLLLLDIHVCS